MDCAETKELLLEYVLGFLSDDKKTELEHHLESCPNCRRSADALLAEEAFIRSVAHHLSLKGSVLPLITRKMVPVYRTIWGRLAIAAGAIAAAILITLLFSAPLAMPEYATTQPSSPKLINAPGNSYILFVAPLEKPTRYTNPPTIEPSLKDRLTDEGTD